MELRTLATELVLKFDVALAPGEDGHRLLYKTRDHFTLGLGDVDLVFTPVSS
jgi:tryprostatin B 6-hydroxylase